MSVKIRLARKGRKKKAFYHIVVADSRAPRDGRFIEKLGIYNPITDPATIELNFDKALDWLQNGAQPTETCRAILSYKGVLMKKHLLDGVKKGAFNEEEAEKRFQLWLKDKENKIEARLAGIEKTQEAEKNKRLEAEKKINEARAEELARKRSELAAEAEAAAKAAAAKTEEAIAEVEGKTKESAPEVEEAIEEEAKEEAKAEEKPVEEAKEEAKAEEKPAEEAKEEAKAEEKPAEEAKEEAKAEEKPAEEAKEEAKAEEKPAEEAKEEDKKEEPKENKE